MMKIGQIEATGYPGRRDAFHVASVLVRSDELIGPKDNVRFTDQSFQKVVPSGVEDRHAIADPFVKEIKIGDLFWVMLIPGSVEDLTHLFVIRNDAPAIPQPEPNDGYPDWVDDESSRADYDRCRGEGCHGY